MGHLTKKALIASDDKLGNLSRDRGFQVLGRLTTVWFRLIHHLFWRRMEQPPPLQGDKLEMLTPEELERKWQVPKDLLHDLARRGEIPFVWVGRKRRFPRAMLEEWIKRGLKKPLNG